jgi:7,8-dihydropterin-6-yl-methyl-4-(beta-D-ribofuranosyl)aminobenzene 5'-phosphate synthase
MIDGMASKTPGGVRVTILVDNRAGEGLLAEHGLSLWIEADGRRILFDTGQGALEFNARVLGVDLGEADALVLSHGHYDHTGGIPAFLRAAGNAGIHCHPGVSRLIVTRYARGRRNRSGCRGKRGRPSKNSRRSVFTPSTAT